MTNLGKFRIGNWPPLMNDLIADISTSHDSENRVSPPGGVLLGISGWGCAAGTLEPLTYTRASSAEFCYPLLE